MQETKYVAYYRTPRTYKKGEYSIKSQRQDVTNQIAASPGKVIREFVEFAGDKGSRPLLQRALQLCEKECAILLVGQRNDLRFQLETCRKRKAEKKPSPWAFTERKLAA